MLMTCLGGEVYPHQVAAVGSAAHSVSCPTSGELTSSKISGSSPGRISATSSSIVYRCWQERMITASPSIVSSTACPSWTRRLSATALGIRIARLFPHLDTRTLIANHFNRWSLHRMSRPSCFRAAGRGETHNMVLTPAGKHPLHGLRALGEVPHGQDHPYPTHGRDHPQLRPGVQRTHFKVGA